MTPVSALNVDRLEQARSKLSIYTKLYYVPHVPIYTKLYYVPHVSIYTKLYYVPHVPIYTKLYYVPHVPMRIQLELQSFPTLFLLLLNP